MEDVIYSDYEQQYLVRNKKEVIQILNDLVKQKVTLKVSFNRNADLYLTNIVAIDEKECVVYLDIGRDEDFNKRLLRSKHVLFAKEDGICIKWISADISEVMLKDGKAIKVSLPNNLVRLQRREFFRFATPLAEPVLCKIPLPIDENDAPQSLELTLVDISLGGIGAMITGERHPALAMGARFEHCQINLPNIGTTDLTLELRNLESFHNSETGNKYRVGMQFISPSRGNEGLINRYVFALERHMIALANGEA